MSTPPPPAPTTSPLEVGLLDLGLLQTGQSVHDALRACLAVARCSDRWGFARFWIGEHHTRDAAWASPELLLPLLACHTRQVRLGTACVLLHYYSPLKVAENFRLLATLFPHRIELGVGRGKVFQPMAKALCDGYDIPLDEAAYADKVMRLRQHLYHQFPPGHPLASVCTTPAEGLAPPLWLLGSGHTNALLAAQHGTAFCLARFLSTASPDTHILRNYYDHFTHGQAGAAPSASLAVAGLCADTEAKALRLKAHYANDFIQINLWGTAEQCREQLETLCERYGTRSCMFFDVQPSVQDRLRSYEALAQTLGLAAPTPIAPLTVA